MSAMTSQTSDVSIVYTTVCSGTDQRKYESSASLAFVRGIHHWPVNSPHKGPVTRKMFPFDNVIMASRYECWEHTALTHFCDLFFSAGFHTCLNSCELSHPACVGVQFSSLTNVCRIQTSITSVITTLNSVTFRRFCFRGTVITTTSTTTTTTRPTTTIPSSVPLLIGDSGKQIQFHYNDISVIAFQITGNSIVCLTALTKIKYQLVALYDGKPLVIGKWHKCHCVSNHW